MDNGTGGKITLRDKAFNRLISKGYDIDYSAIQQISEKLDKNLKLTAEETKVYNEFATELMAHQAELLLGNEDFINKIVASDAGLVEKIIAKLADIKKALKDADGAGTKAQRRNIREAGKLYLKAAEKINDARLARYITSRLLDEEEQLERKKNTTSQRKNADTHIRYSLMNKKSFEQNVSEIINMSDAEANENKKSGNFISVMKQTPNVILDHVEGAENIEIIIRFDALYLATRKDGVLEGHYHDLGIEIVSSLPERISNPDAIIELSNGRLNLFSQMPAKHGNQGLISIELNTVKDINNKYDKYNLVVSLFSAKENYIKNLFGSQNAKVKYKKEGLSQVNPQLYKWLAIINDSPSKISISENAEKVNTSEENKFQYSKKPFAEQVDDVLHDKDTSSTHVLVSSATPALLLEAGVPELPILITAKHIKTIVGASGELKGTYHGMSANILKKIPEYIQNPIMIADSVTQEDSIVLITDALDEQKRPVIVSIHINGNGAIERKYLDANIITSAYGKDGIGTFIKKLADKKAVFYWNKKKSQRLSVNLGLQLPNIITSLDSNTIIRKTNVKIKTSSKNNFRKSLKPFNAQEVAEKGAPKTPGQADISKGELQKLRANTSREKVYSKTEALEVLRKISGIENLKQKDIDAIADGVWQMLNEAPEDEEREILAGDMAEYIVAIFS